jgi:hypothetical protein
MNHRLRTITLAALLASCAATEDDVTRAAQPVEEAQMAEDDTFVDPAFTPRVLVPVPPDLDGDGIPNVVEAAGCTSAIDPDTDDDGIDDGVERGTVAGFNFPANGADPCHRDIFVQEDFEERLSLAGVLESAKMGATLVAELERFYDRLPIANPDGTRGIHLHVLPGNVLPAGVNCANTGVGWVFPQDHFHRASLCLNNGGGYYGFGAIAGQRFRIVAPPVNPNPADDLVELRQYNWYWLFLHELGHNLGLLHGGDVNTNRVPHYTSLMNYLYDESFDGSPHTLQNAGVHYSDGRFMPFVRDEQFMSESGSFPGVSVANLHFLTVSPSPHPVAPCGGVACVDWNRDGAFGGAPSVDVTLDGTTQHSLHDFSDLDHIATHMGDGLPGRP